VNAKGANVKRFQVQGHEMKGFARISHTQEA